MPSIQSLYKKLPHIFVFCLIFALAAFFRLYGGNWDQGQHLHPDERFLTMVTEALQWPRDIVEYFDASTSPLNPHNKGYGFFVYGTFPIFFTRWVTDQLGKTNYGDITLIGRRLAAFFDLGTVLLVFLIAKQLTQIDKAQSVIRKINTWIFPLLAMFFYTSSVLSIQISHFYAVDVYLSFFITLTLYLLIKIISIPKQERLNSNYILLHAYLGMSFGLALGSKISASYFLPVIMICFLLFFIKTKKIKPVMINSLIFISATYITLRFAQPYLFASPNFFNFALNPKILANWKELAHYWKPDSGFPPSIQWFYITPLLFPLKSLMFWGMGLPLSIFAICGVLWVLFTSFIHFLHEFKKRTFFKASTFFNFLASKSTFIFILMITIWSLGLFIYQGILPAPSIRYFHPIYPSLCLITAYFIFNFIKNKSVHFQKKSLLIVIFFILIWPVSFVSIYSRDHSRVLASQWIYQNLPSGSSIAIEHWDDGLPLSLTPPWIHEQYKFIEYPLYNADTSEKWNKMADSLPRTDYIALTSNRLWASLTRVPDKYPVTDRYYHLLFDGRLGFQKVAEVTSYPSLNIPLFGKCLYLLPPQETYLGLNSDKSGFIRLDTCDLYQQTTYQGIVIRDDFAEETFTVYDHPKVLIYKNVRRFPAQKILELLNVQPLP